MMGAPRVVALLVSHLVLLLTTTSAVVSKQPPNIVFIVADDLGWNDVSFHGSKQIPTPNIDALAYDGIILNNYYVQPICTPTRSALLTGRYPIHTGLQHGVIVGAQPYGLGLGEKLLPQYLRELGYVNHIVGKWHLGFYKTEYTPTQRGFDSHYGYYQGDEDYYNHNYWARYPLKETNGFDFRKNLTLDKSSIGKYSTELFTTEAERLIHNHNKAQPLFLYMAQQAVHSGNPDNPLQAPQRYLDKFAHIKNDNRRKFAAMVSALDDSVGNVTRALTQAGLINNTVIMFTTDNGGPVNGFDFNAASNWPLRGCKARLWEGGTRAAGFLWSPLLEKPGYTSPHLMHVTDWFPTTLNLAGYSMDKVPRNRVDGLDMWRTLSTNQESSPRTDILYNIDGKTAALRVQNLKLIQGHQGLGWNGWYPPWQADDAAGSMTPRENANHTAGARSAKSGAYHDLLKDTHTMEKEEVAPGEMFSSGLTPLLQKALGRVLHRPRSAPVVVDCGPRPANASTNCDPVKAPCLYDLTKDPCEFNNLAAAMPTAVKELLVRLEAYRATAVPSRHKREDPKGYPVYHGGNWVPWVNSTL